MTASRPPVLRTKKGCTRCRAFRKKCDEAKPACARCVRAGTPCTWPRSHELKDARLRKTAPTTAATPASPASAPSEASEAGEASEASEASRVVSRSRPPADPSGRSPPRRVRDLGRIGPSAGRLTPCSEPAPEPEPAEVEAAEDDAAEDDAAEDDAADDSAPLLLYTPRPPSTIASARDYALFQYFVTVYFAKQLLPKAYGQFRHVALHVGRLALQDAPLLHIASACAALHLHQTRGGAALHKTALAGYGRSMAALARALSRKPPHDALSEHDKDSIGFTMSFLYIFAASSDDCYHDVSYHVAAAQRYIRARYLDRAAASAEAGAEAGAAAGPPCCRHPPPPLRAADRALLESILYQTFDLTIKGHTAPGPCIDDRFFTTTVQVLQQADQDQAPSSCGAATRDHHDRSPVLGLPLDLYHLVFRIAQLREEATAWLGGGDPPRGGGGGGGGALEEKARRLLPAMHRWEAYYGKELLEDLGGLGDLGDLGKDGATSRLGSDHHTTNDTNDIYHQITLLYVLAASVLLRQILAASRLDHPPPPPPPPPPAPSDPDAAIDVRLRAAARLVAAMDKTDPSANCYLGTWALQVLRHACRPGDAARPVFTSELLRRHRVLKSGDIRRALGLRDAGWPHTET